MTGAKSGEYSRFLSFHGRNPDVLNSIANLSNDEVFTPPEFANKMLDTLEKAWAESNNGENIWSNPDLKFLDPFTKSGVFLREIASRLIKGLESEIPDLQDRVDHILTKQVFGIATTHLTSLMARRSLYCSKKANGKHSVTKKFKDESGNIWFEPLPHTWGKGTVRELTMDESGNEVERYVDGRCQYCGVSKKDFTRDEGLELHAYGLIHNDDPKKWVGEIFGPNMKFDVIIGNPPYQLNESGGAAAMPVFHKFVNQAKLLEPTFLSMVIPARWYSGGRDMGEFRKNMLETPGIVFLHDYFNAATVFPGIDISGGVCYFLWQNGSQVVPTVRNTYGVRDNELKRSLTRDGEGFFIRFNEAMSILKKIDLDQTGRFVDRVSPTNPFGIPRGTSVSEVKTDNSIFIHAYPKNGWIPQGAVTRGQEFTDKWKVCSSKAYGERGEFPYLVTARPFLVPPGEVCAESYIVLHSSPSKAEAQNVMKYATTKFFRFLVLLKKSTQNATSKVFELVPDLDESRAWTDASLADYFGFTDEDRSFIDSMVRKMEA